MLVELRPRLNEPLIQDLLAAAMFPDPDRIRNAIDQYRNDEQLKVLGYEKDSQVIGVIGYRLCPDNSMEILHIAISPDERGSGYGRGIILETIEKEKPKVVFAETDEEAVEFYRNIGFSIQSLGEKYPGVERFKCTFLTDY
jgi:ribosomal protein S18 acetylase RimI-like enzyme